MRQFIAGPPLRQAWVILVNGERAGITHGVVSSIGSTKVFNIGVSVAAEYRGRGVGKYAIALGTLLIRLKLDADEVWATIKNENLASRAAFARVGYVEERGFSTRYGITTMVYRDAAR